MQRRTDSLAQKAEEERLLLEAEEAERARETQAREEKKERELEDLKVGATSSQAGEGQLRRWWEWRCGNPGQGSGAEQPDPGGIGATLDLSMVTMTCAV